MTGLLSVLTPVYNGVAHVGRSYRSLTMQTYTDWEWVVVDDGSKDGTSDLIADLARSDSRIRLSGHTPNRGRGYARGRTLALARGDWSVVWDADDAYHPTRLAVIDRARRDRFDYSCAYAHVVDNELNAKGVRGFSTFLGGTAFVHATLAGRTELLRSIGYEQGLTTVGQIGEDHRMGLVLPARHRGYYHHGVLMVNQEDREVFLLKAIHSNRVRLRVLRELGSKGVLRAPEREWRAEVRRVRNKLLVLEAMRLVPGAYKRTVRYRPYGDVAPGYRPSPDDMAFLDAMRVGFEPQARPDVMAA
jgi:glycosyltransferase involved in cell wall biosynthesis